MARSVFGVAVGCFVQNGVENRKKIKKRPGVMAGAGMCKGFYPSIFAPIMAMDF